MTPRLPPELADPLIDEPTNGTGDEPSAAPMSVPALIPPEGAQPTTVILRTKMVPIATGLTDPKQVLFCEEYARTGDAMLAITKAGIRSYEYTLPVLAQQLLAREDIRAAITAIKAASTPINIEVTRDTIIEDFQQIYQKAMDDSKLADAINAKRAQATVLGVMVVKTEITHKRSTKEMSDEELEKIARGDAVDVSFEDVTDEKSS